LNSSAFATASAAIVAAGYTVSSVAVFVPAG